MIPVAVILLAPALIAGCQSVATTSAKLRNQEGNYELAIDLARQAIAENPNDAEAYFQLGISYSYLDSVSLAYQNFTRALELDPKKERDVKNNIQHNFAKHYKLGQSAYNRKDYETAAEEFELSTMADPTQSVGYYNLGVSYDRLAVEDPKYHDKVVDAMDKVLELSNPSEANYVKALELAGRALVAGGRADEAEERFRRLVEEDPTSYGVIESIGNDFLNAEQWEGAAVFLKMAAEARSKIDDDDFAVYYNIGAALFNLGKDDTTSNAMVMEAVSYYERALAIQDDEPQTIFNIAVAYVAIDQYNSAVDWLEKYVDVSPDDTRGWARLARSYSEMDQKDKARDALERLQKLRENQ
jgi:tetratricopeptide (TPR) repeat protein